MASADLSRIAALLGKRLACMPNSAAMQLEGCGQHHNGTLNHYFMVTMIVILEWRVSGDLLIVDSFVGPKVCY